MMLNRTVFCYQYVYIIQPGKLTIEFRLELHTFLTLSSVKPKTILYCYLEYQTEPDSVCLNISNP